MVTTAVGSKNCSIEEEFVRVQGVKTSVLKLGHLREKDADGPPQTLMLVIPVSTNDNLYGLEAQISHKLAFIRENIPSDTSLILIGHSIGCYMILNILDGLAAKNVARCFMLFPTIERMAVTPNGRTLTPVLRYLRWIPVLLAFFFCFLPQFIRREIMKWLYRKVDYPECTQKALLETVTPWTTNFAMYLGKTEMNKVTTLQGELVEKHLSKLSLYYGSIDDWAPVQYYHDFIAHFPQADAKLCDLRLKHAFILKKTEGKTMAKIIWEWADSYQILVSSN
ncbi:chromosome 2 open reading frame 43 [Elysia marginata]|uniref:Lipid droplet-associated hydrolase n=1 Tax=Elysia marginata TaxID=1093978 RepID=A0AAV4F2S1_9GAST|nr:chromosome 2 open reading frame 43 [Elysia marginata]